LADLLLSALVAVENGPTAVDEALPARCADAPVVECDLWLSHPIAERLRIEAQSVDLIDDESEAGHGRERVERERRVEEVEIAAADIQCEIDEIRDEIIAKHYEWNDHRNDELTIETAMRGRRK
jgi:hypothetical protein